jgi:hypothetical protein
MGMLLTIDTGGADDDDKDGDKLNGEEEEEIALVDGLLLLLLLLEGKAEDAPTAIAKFTLDIDEDDVAAVAAAMVE